MNENKLQESQYKKKHKEKQEVEQCETYQVHEDIVKAVKEKMPEEDVLCDLAEIFKVFGDSTRIKILYLLFESEMCVCDIANVLRMSKSSISHQLGTLRRSGIVKCRKSGKEVFYMLDDNHVKEVFEIGVEHIEHKK